MPALLCVALVGVACSGQKSPAMNNHPATPKSPMASTSTTAATLDADTVADLRVADLVLLGEVLAMGPAPSSWSGRVPQFQTVTYRVAQIIKAPGPVAGEPITVHHPIVHGLRGVQQDRPALDAALLHVGARWVVLATTHGDRREALESDRALLPADDGAVAAVQQAVAAK